MVRFSGRVRQLADLPAWCDGPKAAAVWLLTAPGGYGKTQLARQFAGQMRGRGWQDLSVRPGAGQEAAEAIVPFGLRGSTMRC